MVGANFQLRGERLKFFLLIYIVGGSTLKNFNFYIDGEWIDKETVDENFMSLVKAKECLTFFENCDIIEESKRGENFMF